MTGKCFDQLLGQAAVHGDQLFEHEYTFLFSALLNTEFSTESMQMQVFK